MELHTESQTSSPLPAENPAAAPKKARPKRRTKSSAAPRRRKKSARSSSKDHPTPDDPLLETAEIVEDLPDVVAEEEFDEENGFASMGLSDLSLKAVKKAGFKLPSPIQEAFIPQAITGIDVMGQARTGTGKTAAFVLPMLERIVPGGSACFPQAIVLVPTRELAAQVEQEALRLSYGRKIRTVVLCGGKPMRKQLNDLTKGIDIVIGTPGRVLDHIGRHSLVLDDLKFVVLDEADRMLDIGFRPDIERILRRCPEKRQTLLLSATIPGPVEQLAQRYMHNPVMVNRSPDIVATDTIQQFYVTVEPDRKFRALLALLNREEPQQTIIFCRTKRGTDKLTLHLSKKYDNVSAMHGDMPQRNRDRVMANFRSGEIRCLVATDVVGRGIDVSGISHIINYDIPEFCDDYVHRVGRTGRMGKTGVAFTFVTRDDGEKLTNIEMRINRLLERAELFPGEEPPRPEVTAPLPPPVTSRYIQHEPDSTPTPPPTLSETPAPAPIARPRTRRFRRAL